MSHAKKTITLALLIGYALHIYAASEGNILNQNTIRNVSCTSDTCFFPGNSFAPGDIKVKGIVTWEDNRNLVLHAKGNIRC